MQNILSIIKRNLAFFVSASMLFGFLYGAIFSADFLKIFVVPCAFLIVYPTMVNLKFEKIFKKNDIGLQFSTQIVNFCIIPFISFGIGLIFFGDNPYMLLGMLILGLLPTGGGAISWVGISKGNIESVTKMAVIGPLIGVFLAPLYIKFLIGPVLEIELLTLIRQIVFIVVLPMLLGVLTRRLLLKSDKGENIVSIFPSFSAVGIICIVFIAMALKAKDIIKSPDTFLYIFLPLVLFYLFNFTMTTIIGKLCFKRSSAIAFIYGASMRNLSISLAILINLFDGKGSDAVLVISVAYIIQIQLAVWCKKISDIVFAKRQSHRPALEAASDIGCGDNLMYNM